MHIFRQFFKVDLHIFHANKKNPLSQKAEGIFYLFNTQNTAQKAVIAVPFSRNDGPAISQT